MITEDKEIQPVTQADRPQSVGTGLTMATSGAKLRPQQGAARMILTMNMLLELGEML